MCESLPIVFIICANGIQDSLSTRKYVMVCYSLTISTLFVLIKMMPFIQFFKNIGYRNIISQIDMIPHPTV